MKRLSKLILIVMLSTILAACLFACKDDDVPNTINATNKYTMTLTVSDDLQEVSVSETLNYTNDTGDVINDLVFYLYPNAYTKNAVNPAYVSTPERFGSITINSITCANAPLNYELSESKTIMTVNLSSPLQTGEQVCIDTHADICIPTGTMRLGCADKVTNITNFYPILSVYQNGAWRKDEFYQVGDPFFSDIADYEITIESNPELIIACSADEVSETIADNKKITSLKLNSARDFAMSCSYDFKVLTAVASDVVISYYYVGDNLPENAMATAISSIETFSKNIGAYDGKRYSIVETSYYFGGMEYPRLTFINKNSYDKDSIIIHETAHQWFACSVGSDSINNSWQDEALVTFLANYYHALNGETAKYNTLRDLDKQSYNSYISVKTDTEPDYGAVMTASIYDFKTNYEYSMLEYTKGSLMFDAIYQLNGDKKMSKALNKYYVSCSHKNATPEDLYNAFSSEGIEIKTICDAWLSDQIIMATIVTL